MKPPAIIRLMSLILVTLFLCIPHSLAMANPLLARNLPAGELIYTDGNNAYYGVYLTEQYTSPGERGGSAKGVTFRVVAIRQAEPDGTLVHFEPTTIKDYRGNPVSGKRYAEKEIALVNQHIIGEVDKKFPDRRNKHYLRILVYAKGQYYSGTPVRTTSDNPDRDAPESWVTVLNFERQGEGAPMRPAYEARGNTGLPQSRFARGTQDIKRRQLPDTIAGLRLQHAAERVQAPAAAETKSGQQVVKDQEFWDRLQFSGSVRDVFEGDFSSAPGTLFKIYFSALQWAYSDSCQRYLPDDARKRGYVSQNVYADGYRDAPVERSALIAPRYLKFYDAYADDVSNAMRKRKSSLQSQANTSLSRGGSVLGIMQEIASNEPIAQLTRFIAASGGCETTAVFQLRENYYRAASGMPSLQEAGIVLKNAAEESNKPPPSLYGACMDASSAGKRFCLCFEKEAQSVLTEKEKQLFASDFEEYYKVVRKINTRPRPPATDRAWALVQIRSACN
ncbi:hypothetical protein [Alteromonas halophila]|uniref:Uncharacterized protein n=1 Tax=Alteromonas halophila TaxID=516698 RepID=A0A918JGS1_9ALTE|nr:hypothetical protein [Alteromonas halophila]GGW76362.1 hypothetical protein GCM10007391_06210 [Alteromonas halophila]